MLQQFRSVLLKSFHRINRDKDIFSMLIVAASLSACGGSSSSNNPSVDKVTYSVTGTLSGLTVDGLSLTDGTSTISPAANATTFSFPAQHKIGSSYTVSVLQQPLGFIVHCSVGSNAAGTTSTDVTVAVTCDTARVAVSTLAGSNTQGSVDGMGAAAGFDFPARLAVDSTGNLYVGDGNQIRKITADGVVTTFAGSTTAGHADGSVGSATFFGCSDVAIDSAGNLYVADNGNNAIRKITADGIVTTLAGNTTAGNADGMGAAASFHTPNGLAVDSSGNVYVADAENNAIRKITPAGLVTTLAGNATAGNADGTGSAASFNSPRDVAVDSTGNVYVADNNNNSIRKITADGVVTTLAGTTTAGSVDGTGSLASFNAPSGIALDSVGNIYVADYFNYAVRKITPAGVVTTLAGGRTNPGSADGVGAAASFLDPIGVAVDSFGNVYVSDSGNYKIRKLTPL